MCNRIFDHDVCLSFCTLPPKACAQVNFRREQLIPMFGLSALEQTLSPHSTLDKLLFLVEHLPRAHLPTTIVSFSALLSLIVLRTLKRFCAHSPWQPVRTLRMMPEVFFVVLLSTILCSVFHWDEDGVAILGNVPVSLSGGSFIRWPFDSGNLKYLRRTTTTAGVVSIIGFLDSIVAAKQNGARFQYAVSANRELVALGLANVAGSFIPGTLPAYGSITRSVYAHNQ
jgi:MFS superfamily sulfate permease-like transporter